MQMTDEAADVAVVSGAGRGVGRAVAVRLAAAGYRVIAAARTTVEVEATASCAPGIVAVTADVGTDAGVAAIARAADAQGALRVWVNNAGIVERVPFADLDPGSWDRVLSINLRGAFVGSRAAFEQMAGGGGVIVNIASLSGGAYVEQVPVLAASHVPE